MSEREGGGERGGEPDELEWNNARPEWEMLPCKYSNSSNGVFLVLCTPPPPLALSIMANRPVPSRFALLLRFVAVYFAQLYNLRNTDASMSDKDIAVDLTFRSSFKLVQPRKIADKTASLENYSSK